MNGPPFFVLEMEVYLPGSGIAETATYGIGSRPIGASQLLSFTQPAVGSVYASDQGYVGGLGGGTVYPPTLSTAFEMDLETSLDPHSSAGGYQFGSVVLTNADRRYDGMGASQNNDGRPMRVLMGYKIFDASRGIYLDPDYGSLTVVWSGIGQPWSLDDVSLTCPVRDPTYWIEGPVQTSLYGGTGGYDGNSTLTGLPIPKTRGGTAAAPVQNVSPVQIDPVNLVYQYTDGAGTIVTLYEGADGANITRDADVPDLYSGPPPAAGHYRTCNARGCFQLGSKPVQAITADVTGEFPVIGPATTLMALAYGLMVDDMVLPSSLLDASAFAAADAAYPYTAGIFIGDTVTDGATTLATLLSSIGAQLVPSADGTLRPFVLRAPPAGAGGARIDTSSAVSVTPVPLPSALFPPTASWRVGYQHVYTVQTSGLLPNATAARTQQVAQSDQYAGWASADVLAAYKRPNIPNALPGVLLAQADAQAAANDLGALWGVRRNTYDVVVPISYGVGRQIGDLITLAWPMDNMDNGVAAQVVGISFRSYDATVTLRVLV